MKEKSDKPIKKQRKENEISEKVSEVEKKVMKWKKLIKPNY